MGVVDEEGRNTADNAPMIRATSMQGRSRDPEPSSHLRTGMKKMSAAVRNTKHGSFDFERPGWGTSFMQRTASNETSRTAPVISSSARDQPQDRDSTWGPGLAGVGTLQRDVSIRRAKVTEEGWKARERARRLEEYIQNDRLPPIPSDKTNGHSPHHSDPQNSTSTNGTGQTGKSSNLSKGTGKRSGPGSRGGSGAGLTRLIGAAQHPLFSFEPPVPSPTRSSGSNGNSVDTVRPADRRGSKLKDELKSRDSNKKSSLKGDRLPVPVPTPSGIPSPSGRSGNRGRSLDLGLGLAWAPSTMKESALLPSTTLFGRSGSISSAGRSTSGSTAQRTESSSTTGTGNGISSPRRLRTQDPQRDSKLGNEGKEVADMFKTVLDDRAYNAFKLYVRRFDQHEIPFDGRNGIVERVENLLTKAPGVSVEDKRIILEKFVRIILQNA